MFEAAINRFLGLLFSDIWTLIWFITNYMTNQGNSEQS